MVSQLSNGGVFRFVMNSFNSSMFLNFPGSAGPLSAFAATGHLAMFAGVGEKLHWDVKKMRCTNNEGINRLVGREYRPGWEV